MNPACLGYYAIAMNSEFYSAKMKIALREREKGG